MKLHLLSRIKNLRVLLWHKDYLYASRGYTLLRCNSKKLLENDRVDWEKVAFFKPNFIRNLASYNRILTRLTRAGFHFLEILPNEKMISILSKNIAILMPREKEFKTTFKIKRGTRPLGMAITPDGKIYWGEYFNNPERDEVNIYGSEDGGNTWEVVYTFPKGSIRHVHNIIYDQFDDSLWILTGDEGKEPKILHASNDCRVVDIVLEGNQQARAATLIARPKGVYYATDTPYEQNYIYFLDRNGSREKILPISGPSMWSCEVDSAMFFSTAAEPSKLYYGFACIYGKLNGNEWQRLIEWPKDNLHPKYFQFGNVVLPRGKDSNNLLAATGVAVRNEEGATTIWKIERS
jgi:hypothetical protein